MSDRARRSPSCLFRVAAGPRLGFGHLMRARALADGLDVPAVVSLHGGRAAHAAALAAGCDVIKARGMKRVDVVVVDDPSERRSREWIARAQRAGALVVRVHDGGAALDADLVVSGSLGVGRPRARGRVLTGVKFYLLDRRVAKRRTSLARCERVSRRPRVLVALGGGQHVRAIAERLVEEVIRRCPTASIAVAAGFARGPLPRLRHARWVVARTGLARALRACDVAIVAGGVTLYEACALGVPAVGLAVAPAQRRAIRAFARRRALLDAGGGPCTRRHLARAAEAVARLLENTRLRSTTAARSQRLVDGLGAERVAACIRALALPGGSRAA